MEDEITISLTHYEMLLNALANQKFVDEMRPDMREIAQSFIDAEWKKGMSILSDARKRTK